MGYRKKGSLTSLKASAAVAGVLLLAAALIGGQYNTAGLLLALGDSPISSNHAFIAFKVK